MACTKVFKYPKRMPCPPKNIDTNMWMPNFRPIYTMDMEKLFECVIVRYKPVAKRTQTYAPTETATW